MDRDELRRTCRESIDRPDAENVSSQAGKGLAYAAIILELLDELETAEAKVAALAALRDSWKAKAEESHASYGWLVDAGVLEECADALGQVLDPKGDGHGVRYYSG